MWFTMVFLPPSQWSFLEYHKGRFYMGPILFLIYIDDINQVKISCNSRLVIYADDLLLYHPIIFSQWLQLTSSNINLLNDWTKLNLMTFNSSKCNAMLVSWKTCQQPPPSPLTLDGVNPEFRNSYKYIGVLISSDLSYMQDL